LAKKVSDDCLLTRAVGVSRKEYSNFQYYPVDENWQLQTCERLRLRFTQGFVCQTGSPDTILTCPDLRTLKQINGDGNCLFRAISYTIAGSEEQHFALRNALISYMLSIPHLLIGHGPDGHRNYADALSTTNHSSVEEYIYNKQPWTVMVHGGVLLK